MFTDALHNEIIIALIDYKAPNEKHDGWILILKENCISASEKQSAGLKKTEPM